MSLENDVETLLGKVRGIEIDIIREQYGVLELELSIVHLENAIVDKKHYE